MISVKRILIDLDGVLNEYDRKNFDEKYQILEHEKKIKKNNSNEGLIFSKVSLN